jgi:hypothetical protein
MLMIAPPFSECMIGPTGRIAPMMCHQVDVEADVPLTAEWGLRRHESKGAGPATFRGRRSSLRSGLRRPG